LSASGPSRPRRFLAVGDEVAVQRPLAPVELAFERFLVEAKAGRDLALRQVVDVAQQQDAVCSADSWGASSIVRKLPLAVEDANIPVGSIG